MEETTNLEMAYCNSIVSSDNKKNDNAIHKVQAWVVRKVDNIIHWTNHYPADGMVCFVNTYPLDSDLSNG